MKLKRVSSIQKFNPENVISNPDPFEKKKEWIEEDEREVEVNSFSDDGIFSKRVFGDLNSKNQYSCKCKDNPYTGEFYADGHFICPRCGCPVEKIEANIDKEGWIDLKDIYLIKYISYKFLEKFMGVEVIKNIISSISTITLEGDLDVETIEAMRLAAGPKGKYYYIGIEEFYKQYLEILKFYYDINKGKADREFEYLSQVFLAYTEDTAPMTNYEKLLETLYDKDNVFTNKIPVVSVVLRPAMRTSEGFREDEIDRDYSEILLTYKMLDSKVDQLDLVKDANILQLQSQYMQLCEKILDNIKSKEGLIRNQICGTRINFSARNIISPAKVGTKIDEVVLPYITFIELYKYEIINILGRIKNISKVKAQKIWESATTNLDEEVYNIMSEMIQNDEIGILINRNPTLAYGSILYLKVVRIKHDYYDMTMSIHNSILALMAADYDGDVVNIISIKDKSMREVFKHVFSPISLIIDPNNAMFNIELNLKKDQVLGLNNLLS